MRFSVQSDLSRKFVVFVPYFTQVTCQGMKNNRDGCLGCLNGRHGTDFVRENVTYYAQVGSLLGHVIILRTKTCENANFSSHLFYGYA